MARPTRPPLSGLISTRRWVTAVAAVDQISRSKVVSGGLKLNSCRTSFSIRPPAVRRDGDGQLLRPAHREILNLQADLSDRLRAIEKEDQRLLPGFGGDPATASRSAVVIEGVVYGMVGLFRGRRHRCDVSNRDFVFEG